MFRKIKFFNSLKIFPFLKKLQKTSNSFPFKNKNFQNEFSFKFSKSKTPIESYPGETQVSKMIDGLQEKSIKTKDNNTLNAIYDNNSISITG